MARQTVFFSRNSQYHKDIILPKLIYKCNVIPMNIHIFIYKFLYVYKYLNRQTDAKVVNMEK